MLAPLLHCTFIRKMAATIDRLSAAFTSLLLFHGILLSAASSKDEGIRTRKDSLVKELEVEYFQEPGYFSADVHRDIRAVYPRRHRRAVRYTEYSAPPVQETQTGLLFTVSSVLADAPLRRFTLNSTSVDFNLVNVDESTGSVYLADGQRLDYENESMRRLSIVVKATKIIDMSGTGSKFLLLDYTIYISFLTPVIFSPTPTPVLAIVLSLV